MKKRISKVSPVIVSKPPSIATITAERNISQTPGRERRVSVSPPNANNPANTKKIVEITVPFILLLFEKY
ncbi:MAG TPA: hypothetical protein PLG47_03080 [Candidatus Dojkabacteria bacterium]|nr:hypothetical protein [Candidatus Dojkabacteria bacterium]